MKKLLLVFPVLLLGASAWAGEVGSYPNASALGGTERMLSDQGGVTVDITPAQITTYFASHANTFSAAQTFPNSGILLTGSSTGITTFASANASATNYTLTFPAASDTVVTLAATQTLSNKTITGSQISTAVATATALAATPSQCGGSQFATGITANGTANCSTPTSSGNVSNTGTPVSGQLAQWTNATTVQGLNVTGTGNAVLATSPTLVTPNLGTPSTLSLVNATGLPISSGVTGLATGIATFLATPTSANLASAVTNETGSGNLVFSTSPTLVTPALGTPSALVLTNASGLPLTTGVTGSLAFANMNLSSANIISLWVGGGTCSSTTWLRGDGQCTAPSGSGTVNSGTSGTLAGYTSTGTAVSPLTIGAGLTLNGTTVTATGSINAQTGTSYTFVATDAAKLVTFSNASATAVTLPVATTTGFGAGFALDVQNKGAGTVTITPTTSTINGSSSLAIATNLGCSVTSDGANYQVSACTALGAAGVASLASGTQALGTSAISSGACATTITVAVTGGSTSNTANITFTTDPNTVTGYKASSSGGLYVNAFMTSGNLNIETCNSTAASITPAAMSVHYNVTNP